MRTDSPNAHVPLYVDLDGTLIKSDTLWDSVALLARHSPVSLAKLPFWALEGPAALKDNLASVILPNPALLPYREELLAWIKTEKATGRRIVLATAAHHKIAEGVAEHTGCFDAVLATTLGNNLKGSQKLAAIQSDCNDAPFAYAGDSRPDLRVWKAAKHAVLAGHGVRYAKSLDAATSVEKVFPQKTSILKAAIKAIRPHQWVKNILVFLPLLAAHRLGDARLLFPTFGIFVAFSLCASSVYLLNDLVDIENDRAHHRKRKRPFAAGTLPIQLGLVLTPTLLLASFLITWIAAPNALGVIGLYWVATCAYSFGLKRKVLLDAFILAGLYTVRSVAGSTLLETGLSHWMMAFLIFLFLSLAFAKRFTELHSLQSHGGKSAKGRGYHAEDMIPIGAFGVASAFVTALIAGLYVTGSTVAGLYSKPEYLWAIAPLVLFWLCRIWLSAWRGNMHEDPVVFALKDKATYIIGMLTLAFLLLSAPKS
jgi:4-hydroxybenzoate polyprenyltransferase